MRTRHRHSRGLTELCAALAGLFAATALSGCMVMGGTSRGGFFLWPGGFGLLVLILVVVFLLRRR